MMNNSAKPRYRVVTAISPPFVMYNNSNNAFYGYCIDLLNDLQTRLNFDYVINRALENDYGYMDEYTGEWRGAIRQLLMNQADMIVGPMWITRDRSSAVDFTVPFYRQTGFTIMAMRKKKPVPFLKFLMVLEFEVWLGFALAFLLTTFLIYIFEKHSPFSHRNNPKKHEEHPNDRFSSLKECFWFTSTSITPEGGGETPKNLSGKLAAATWWLFGFVIVAAYTANLAAYQTLERLETHIESLDDLRKQYAVEYSTVMDSSTYRYFYNMAGVEKKLFEIWRAMSLNERIPDWERSQYTVWEYPLDEKYTKIFHVMETVGFFNTTEEGVMRVKRSNSTRGFALIHEATPIRYAMMRNCEFRRVGEEFSKRPFGIALRKGLPIRHAMNEVLTTLSIKMRLHDLEKKWWDDNPENVHCSPEPEVNAGFGMDTLTAVFILVFIGIFLTIIILPIEYCWYRYQENRRKKRMEHRAQTAVNVINSTKPGILIGNETNFLESGAESIVHFRKTLKRN